MLFYVEVNGKSVGPLTQREIETKIEEGCIGRKTLVWHQDLADWQPLDEVFNIELLNESGSPSLQSLKPSKTTIPPPPPKAAGMSSVYCERSSISSKAEHASFVSQKALIIAAVIVGMIVLFAAFMDAGGDLNDAGESITLQELEGLKSEARKLSEELQNARLKLPQSDGDAGNKALGQIAALKEEVRKLTEKLQETQQQTDSSLAGGLRDSALHMKPDPNGLSDNQAAAGQSAVGLARNANLIGPSILGIQLGDNVERVCERFNAVYGSSLNGQRMEVRRLTGDGSIVCSTPDGLQAVQNFDSLAQADSKKKPNDILGRALLGVLGGAQVAMQASLVKGPVIHANKDGTIWKIVIGPLAGNNLFGGAALMSNQEFAGLLAAKYNFPEMDAELVEQKDIFSGSTQYVPKYHCFSREGFSITIDADKMIVIEKL